MCKQECLQVVNGEQLERNTKESKLDFMADCKMCIAKKKKGSSDFSSFSRTSTGEHFILWNNGVTQIATFKVRW